MNTHNALNGLYGMVDSMGYPQLKLKMTVTTNHIHFSVVRGGKWMLRIGQVSSQAWYVNFADVNEVSNIFAGFSFSEAVCAFLTKLDNVAR